MFPLETLPTTPATFTGTNRTLKVDAVRTSIACGAEVGKLLSPSLDSAIDVRGIHVGPDGEIWLDQRLRHRDVPRLRERALIRGEGSAQARRSDRHGLHERSAAVEPHADRRLRGVALVGRHEDAQVSIAILHQGHRPAVGLHALGQIHPIDLEIERPRDDHAIAHRRRRHAARHDRGGLASGTGAVVGAAGGDAVRGDGIGTRRETTQGLRRSEVLGEATRPGHRHVGRGAGGEAIDVDGEAAGDGLVCH